MDGKAMSKRTNRLTLDQPARYRVQVVGHLDDKRAAWFECLDLVREYGEVRDQAMLHSLLAQIRDLGLPLLAADRVQ